MHNAEAAGRAVTRGDPEPQSIAIHQAEFFESAPLAGVWVDRHGMILRLNPAAEKWLTDAGLAVGASLIDGLVVADRARFQVFLKRLFALSIPARCELGLQRRNGPPRNMAIEAVPAAAGSACLFIRDTVDPGVVSEQIRYLSRFDPLTGLPNRRQGIECLQQVLEAAPPGRLQAVLFIDLDKFKYVNDTHGHAIGDLLLQAVARRLGDEIGAGDRLCRTSANEFMAILPAMASHDDISIVCARMLFGLATAFEFDGIVLNISCCIGVAVGPEQGRDGETLMRNAATALHEAKKAGASRYRFFEPKMNANLANYMQVRDALTHALEHDEFELHYQPQIELGTGRVIGVEALIRWRRPGHGLTLPGAFIGVAEESGLIVPIGRWVLHEACRQAAAWHAAGWNDLVVAVNLSSVQFCAREELVEDVMSAISRSGLDPCCLELELTESSLLEHDQQITASIAQWKASGIQLSIDDFGTGYSSLAYLKRLNVDKLKIDRAFIVGLLEDEQDRAIVEAMIRIARSLNLRCLAEGVEQAAEAALLSAMGCDQAQGYLYSRPLPAAELEDWLRGHQDTVVQWPPARPALQRWG